jgi:nucleoid DNA-binding protein
VKKNTFAKRLAQKSHVTTAQAADKIDKLVSRILKDLKDGQSVSVPGVGEFKRRSKVAKRKVNAK